MTNYKLPSVPLFEIGGSPRHMGRMLGEQAAGLIQSMLDDYRTFMHKVSGFNWDEALRESHKYLPYAQAAFPQYIEEVAGIAEGAGVTFQDAWLLNCYEGVAEDQKLMACTTIGVNDDVTADGHVYLAHNEDWISGDSKRVYLVRATPDGAPPFLAMSYGPMLCNVGLNAAGIAVGINSVYPDDVRVGVPRTVFSRAILATERLSDAIRACLPNRRAGGYNYLLADRHGEIFNVESSAADHDMLYAHEGWLVHTNHYLSPRMRDLEQTGVYASSNIRLRRAERLLRRQVGEVTAESLQAILRDHASHPDSICNHEDMGDELHDRSRTLLSMVMDLTDMMIWVAPGPPCCGDYVPHELRSPAGHPAHLTDRQATCSGRDRARPASGEAGDQARRQDTARAILVDGATAPS
jgi:isopenicillin-N N-acyltransferase-like protein